MTTRWSRQQRVMWLDGWESVMISHHLCPHMTVWPHNNTKLSNYKTLWVTTPYCVSLPNKVCLKKHSCYEDIILVPFYVLRSREFRAEWLYEKEPLKVTHHPGKIGGQRNSGNEDIIVVLVFHMILEENMIKRSCGFMSRNSSWCVTTLSGLQTIWWLLLQ